MPLKSKTYADKEEVQNSFHAFLLILSPISAQFEVLGRIEVKGTVIPVAVASIVY